MLITSGRLVMVEILREHTSGCSYWLTPLDCHPGWVGQ